MPTEPDDKQTRLDDARARLRRHRREGRAANLSLTACAAVSIASSLYMMSADNPEPWVDAVQHGTALGCIALIALNFYETAAIKRILAEFPPEEYDIFGP